MYKAVIALALLSLVGCSATYQPLTGTYGYVVIPKNDIHHIEYHGTDKGFVENSWLQAANETCPSGFETLSKTEDVIRGTVKSPVAGQMVNLGTQDVILLGKIKCHVQEAGSSVLTDFAWKKSSAQQVDYFSHAYVAKKIEMRHDQVRFIGSAPTTKVIEYLDWKFGKSVAEVNDNGLKTKVWLNRNTVLASAVAVTYKDECPNVVKILPPFSVMLLGGANNSKNLEKVAVMSSGIYKAYPKCTDPLLK
ncbi:hypothetical protein [Pseudoalteromonas obscura]|uniref:Lipoprotein n=1 Tax=Pseudoalteromonas obscura TaxID=3048491 RepID=A0ABT7EKN5_9GAMM|nr:hypothetical protein [Pseudoalteromonas sp. P94(2023)]MDK2595615.1 hypothetical protein [Pseudoalteromonas sp. P94(2023)]